MRFQSPGGDSCSTGCKVKIVVKLCSCNKCAPSSLISEIKRNIKQTVKENRMEIGNFGYYWLDTWVMSNVIQLATQDFCRRYLNRSNDPCGRQYDQMTQAARSVPANIAEGNSRHATSKETEMRLTDVSPREPRRTGQRLPELAPPARRAPMVGEIGHLPQGGKHPP